MGKTKYRKQTYIKNPSNPWMVVQLEIAAQRQQKKDSERLEKAEIANIKAASLIYSERVAKSTLESLNGTKSNFVNLTKIQEKTIESSGSESTAHSVSSDLPNAGEESSTSSSSDKEETISDTLATSSENEISIMKKAYLFSEDEATTLDEMCNLLTDSQKLLKIRINKAERIFSELKAGSKISQELITNAKQQLIILFSAVFMNGFPMSKTMHKDILKAFELCCTLNIYSESPDLINVMKKEVKILLEGIKKYFGINHNNQIIRSLLVVNNHMHKKDEEVKKRWTTFIDGIILKCVKETPLTPDLNAVLTHFYDALYDSSKSNVACARAKLNLVAQQILTLSPGLQKACLSCLVNDLETHRKMLETRLANYRFLKQNSPKSLTKMHAEKWISDAQDKLIWEVFIEEIRGILESENARIEFDSTEEFWSLLSRLQPSRVADEDIQMSEQHKTALEYDVTQAAEDFLKEIDAEDRAREDLFQKRRATRTTLIPRHEDFPPDMLPGTPTEKVIQIQTKPIQMPRLRSLNDLSKQESNRFFALADKAFEAKEWEAAREFSKDALKEANKIHDFFNIMHALVNIAEAEWFLVQKNYKTNIEKTARQVRLLMGELMTSDERRKRDAAGQVKALFKDQTYKNAVADFCQRCDEMIHTYELAVENAKKIVDNTTWISPDKRKKSSEYIETIQNSLEDVVAFQTSTALKLLNEVNALLAKKKQNAIDAKKYFVSSPESTAEEKTAIKTKKDVVSELHNTAKEKPRIKKKSQEAKASDDFKEIIDSFEQSAQEAAKLLNDISSYARKLYASKAASQSTMEEATRVKLPTDMLLQFKRIRLGEAGPESMPGFTQNPPSSAKIRHG